MAITRQQLAAEIADAVRAFQDATDAVDHAAAQRLGINDTDRRCLALLGSRGPMTAGQLATTVGLTTGAATAAIDRLEGHGYVERVHDQRDRRRVMIERTPLATTLTEHIWGPLGKESYARLMRRNKDELQAILDFLHEGTRFQVEHADRIQQEALAPSPPIG